MLTNYEERIMKILKELNIPASYERDTGLQLQIEAADLVDAGVDMFNRPQKMTGKTLDSWQKMKDAALQDKVDLRLVSAFRSVNYQKDIFLRKLKKGLLIDDILKVNAAPGYSEHHTGRALDLGIADEEPLTIEFENSPAFHWLSEHAQKFSFFMSFPKDNPHKIDYEPWHWAYTSN